MEPRDATLPPIDGPVFWEGLQREQIKSLKFDLRSGFIMFSRSTPELAAEYLNVVTRSERNDDLVRSILRMRGTLAQAAPTELAALRDLVKSALGENPERRDVIEVREIQYDRTAQWDAEDKRKKDESFQRNVVYISILAIPLAALVFFGYLIWNQRRRMQDMDLARQRELDRQRLLASAQEGISGTITVEDQARMEGQRRAQSIARTKPAVVADLIRTWLSEDEAA